MKLLLLIAAFLLPLSAFTQQNNDQGYGGWQTIWPDPYGGPGHVDVRYKVEHDKYLGTMWDWQLRHNFSAEVRIDYRRHKADGGWYYSSPQLKPEEIGGDGKLGVEPGIEILGVTMKTELIINGKVQEKWLVFWTKGGYGAPQPPTPPTGPIAGAATEVFGPNGEHHYYGAPRWVGGLETFGPNGQHTSVPPHWEFGEPISTPSN